jgi:hypothetical protein
VEEDMTAETSMLSWTVRPWRERKVLSVIAIVLVVGLSVLFGFAAGEFYWGVLAFLVLGLSIRSHYVSTAYRLDDSGVTIETRWQKKHRPWQKFRTFRVDKDRLILSPFGKYSWLEPYRSTRLRLRGNVETVQAFTRRFLTEQEPRVSEAKKETAEEGTGLSEFEESLLDRVASKIVGWRMSVPAVLFLETGKPLSFLGSQALIFLEPFVRSLFTLPDYEKFCQMIERRENVERLIRKIEAKEEEIKEQERQEKLRRKKCRQRT